MKVTFEDCVVEGQTVAMTGKFVMSLKEIEEGAKKERFGPESVNAQVMAAIAKEVAEQYLKEHKMELVNRIDLDAITNAVQLKVVEQFSLNQR